ncbi:holo-ACP synthase [Streptomyces umbrinus]|uniref:holo-ACP synthase n=1 Tax=Streptomyces umbrinus TaxID=67370 RepID=UPI003C30305D
MIGIVLQTGVDMVDVERLARMVTLSGDAFLESSWTPAERLYCANRPERLASRWAAKEATMKALGHGVGQISPLEVEVEASEGQMPTLLLSGNAAARARQLHLDTWSVSLTHEDRWALAFVVGLGNTGYG